MISVPLICPWHGGGGGGGGRIDRRPAGGVPDKNEQQQWAGLMEAFHRESHRDKLLPNPQSVSCDLLDEAEQQVAALAYCLSANSLLMEA